MKNIALSLLFVLCAAGAVLADVLYLRDGSTVKGTFISYENNQFAFESTDGRQTLYNARNVTRLVIERDSASSDTRYRKNPRRSSESPATFPASSGTRWGSSTPFDVRLDDQWIRSQVQVRKGQRVRVEASGTVTLEGRTAVSPDGVPNGRDPEAPLPLQNDGALIAVIGNDDDAPVIFVGRRNEFVADRDGMLYFSVNHWNTRNSSGAFRVTVSVDRGRNGSPFEAAQKREKVVVVPGNQVWTDTGIDVEANALIEIEAEGEIAISAKRRTGPDGDDKNTASSSNYPVPTSSVGALIAKIRYRNGKESGNLFIGSSGQIRIGSSESGHLFVGINDDYLKDNTGSYSVTIRW